MTVTITHNPDCGTSRNALALIRASGEDPVVVEYLRDPLPRERVRALVAAAGLTVREALRENGTPFHELGLADPALTDDQLLDAVEAHPILLNRPFLETPRGTRLCRPSERVLDLLDAPVAKFIKEDGAAPPVELPSLLPGAFERPDPARLSAPLPDHLPRILLLHGSLRPRSCSRLLTFEAQRLLDAMGCETRVFHANGLPLPDDADASHPKVQELREAMLWSEGQVWTSPERHGAMSAVMKGQIDWIPLPGGAVRPTQGRTLAVMQVSGGSQSFNAVNQMRLLGHWMRMVTIPNQSSVARAWQEFGEDGRMRPSAFYDRVVDVMEELAMFTLLTRGVSGHLTSRHSERKEAAEKLDARVGLRSHRGQAALKSRVFDGRRAMARRCERGAFASPGSRSACCQADRARLSRPPAPCGSSRSPARPGRSPRRAW